MYFLTVRTLDSYSKNFRFFFLFPAIHLTLSLLQMASELHGMLAGNVSMVTGDNMKPAYGGEDESFLKLVVSPIYEVISRVGIH
jgi:hypothetical protein